MIVIGFTVCQRTEQYKDTIIGKNIEKQPALVTDIPNLLVGDIMFKVIML